MPRARQQHLHPEAHRGTAEKPDHGRHHPPDLLAAWGRHLRAITRPSIAKFVHTEHPQTLSGRGGALDLVTGASTVAASGCQRGGTVCRDTLSCAGAGPLVCTGIPASAGLTLAFGPDTGRRGRSGGYAAYPHRNAGRGTAADGRRCLLGGPTTPIWAAGALVRALIGRQQTALSEL